MSKKGKLSIYAKIHEIDGPIQFCVEPTGTSYVDKNQWIIEMEHDLTKKSTIKIHLISNLGQKSHLTIEEIFLDGHKLNNFDIWSNYVVNTGTTKKTYGYMSEPGFYIINIHQNAIAHNYMSYFLSKCIKTS
jgi:hypothetical protein